MYKIECEWDLGLEWEVYKTEEAAKSAAAQALKDAGIDDDPEELIEEGLLSFRKLNVND